MESWPGKRESGREGFDASFQHIQGRLPSSLCFAAPARPPQQTELINRRVSQETLTEGSQRSSKKNVLLFTAECILGAMPTGFASLFILTKKGN